MKHIDLRSDTVTKPTDGMRRAMYDAEVGDDVYGEDPTVNRLQETAAEMTGKDAALFVPSGSMGNLIPLFLLCGRGNEVVTHKESHIMHYELGSLAALAGVMPVAVEGERGVLTPDAVAPQIRPAIYYMARTRMVEIENTHNRAGGTFYTQEELEAIHGFARRNDLAVHLDGARMFNAVIATGMKPKRIAERCDSLTFCLSKGLGAPVGSLLCGERDFIAEAKRVRKMLGGGMRQAGVLAAAGIYALENNIELLRSDHEHAAALAAALAETAWADIDASTVQTNILYFDTPSAEAQTVVAALGRRGALCSAMGPRRVRMVTSMAVGDAEIDEVKGIIASLSI